MTSEKAAERPETVIVTPIPNSAGEEDAVAATSVETYSMWKIFPWFGVLALWGSFLSILGSMAVLLVARGTNIENWIQWGPSTYLGVVASGANVLVHVALAEGIIIQWWWRASKQDTTVKELHETYMRSISTWESLKSFKSPNSMAIAVLCVSLIAVNAPILQRSVQSGPNTKSDLTNVTVPLATDLSALKWNTGIYLGATEPSVLSSVFTWTASNWLFNAPETFLGTGCEGYCDGQISGFGFAMTCSNETSPINIPLPNTTGSQTANSTLQESVLLFNVSIAWNHTNPGTIDIMTLQKRETGCSGEILRQTCRLEAARIRYDFSISPVQKGTKSYTIAATTLDPRSAQVEEIFDVTAESIEAQSLYGGFFLVLRDKYTTTTEVRTNFQANEQDTNVNGSLSNYYAAYDDTYNQKACGLNFASDPMASILSDVQTLAFMTASDAGANQFNQPGYSPSHNPNNGIFAQSAIVTVTETKDETIYNVYWLYWGMSVLITSIACFGVAPIYRGWWVLRRKVSLSPIETARAFSAPGLTREDHDDQQQQHDSEGGEDVSSPTRAMSPRPSNPKRHSTFGINTEDTPELLDRVGKAKIRETMSLHMPVVTDDPKGASGGLNYFFPRPAGGQKSPMSPGPKSPVSAISEERESEERHEEKKA